MDKVEFLTMQDVQKELRGVREELNIMVKILQELSRSNRIVISLFEELNEIFKQNVKVKIE